MADPVRSAQGMLAGMSPTLIDGDVIFCSTVDPALAARAMPAAIGSFREAEGMSLLLPLADALALGFDCGAPMRQITLSVYSALDGVGLTAAVASILAEHGIPCNMVAAFHHDHVFVPSKMAEAALGHLRALQAASA
ncbi:ACT domain-containing protein [Dongia sp.]|uniref:ACT domain-containing protein n=1 Tax=Dongia sp. TaxID=1977262 RepID=UPI0035AE6EDF